MDRVAAAPAARRPGRPATPSRSAPRRRVDYAARVPRRVARRRGGRAAGARLHARQPGAHDRGRRGAPAVRRRRCGRVDRPRRTAASRASRSTARAAGAASTTGSRRPARSRRRSMPEPDWPFNIIYSSGTTGEPKGIVQAHGMRWAHVRRGAKLRLRRRTRSRCCRRRCTPTPRWWCSSRRIAYGGCVVLMPKFDAGRLPARWRSSTASRTPCWCRCSTSA